MSLNETKMVKVICPECKQKREVLRGYYLNRVNWGKDMRCFICANKSDEVRIWRDSQ